MLILRYVLAVALIIPAVYTLLYTLAGRTRVDEGSFFNTHFFYFWAGIVALISLGMMMADFFLGHSILPAWLAPLETVLRLATVWFMGCLFARAQASHATVSATTPARKGETSKLLWWARLDTAIIFAAFYVAMMM